MADGALIECDGYTQPAGGPVRQGPVDSHQLAILERYSREDRLGDTQQAQIAVDKCAGIKRTVAYSRLNPGTSFECAIEELAIIDAASIQSHMINY